MKVTAITKLEAADALLDRAVEMLLDHRDFISAIVLGGSAEDILQDLLVRQGKAAVGARAQIIPHLRKFTALFDPSEPPLMDGQGHSLLRHTFNWLRHANDEGDADPGEFDLETEAVTVVERAIENRHSLDGTEHQRVIEVVRYGRTLLKQPTE